MIRQRLGFRQSAQKTRHRKLQRRRHLASQLLPVHPLATLMHNRSDRTSLYYGTHSQHLAPQEGHGQILRG